MQELASFRKAVLDRGGGSGNGTEVAGKDTFGGHDFRSCLAITRRWISLVPSPMVQSFTSR
jgi:hypothetical protein